MTVEELIKQLEEIPNKKLEVYIHELEWIDLMEIDEVVYQGDKVVIGI